MSKNIAVIGASAAGLFTAELLARSGHRVTVFERTPALDPPPRTLIVTSSMTDVLGPESEVAVVNEIRRFQLVASQTTVAVALGRPDLVIERSHLIAHLAQRAQVAGADIALGMRLADLTAADGGIAVRLRGDAGVAGGDDGYRFDVVVGADGASSRVAACAGWPRQPTVPLVQAIVEHPAAVPVDTSVVWFEPRDTPYFYWLIGERDGRAAVGLIGDGARSARATLDRFLARQDMRPLAYQAARIPLYARWVPIHRRVGGGDVYLVGDAAGQVKVSTIGGIVTGFGGSLAVAEAVSNGRPGREARRLRRELDAHLFVRRLLHHFSERDFARLLELVGRRPASALSAYDRDHTVRLLARLPLWQPRLVAVALRSLLRGKRFPAPGELVDARLADDALRPDATLSLDGDRDLDAVEA